MAGFPALAQELVDTSRQIPSLQRKQVDLQHLARNNFPFPPPPPRRSEHSLQHCPPQHCVSPQRQRRSRCRSPGKRGGHSLPLHYNRTRSSGRQGGHSPTRCPHRSNSPHQRSRSPFKGQPSNAASVRVSPSRRGGGSIMAPPTPPLPAAVPVRQVLASSLVKPLQARPSNSTIAARARLSFARTRVCPRRPTAGEQLAQDLTESEAATSRHPLTYADLHALLSSSNLAQQSLSIEQMGLIFHGFNTSRRGWRPTKQTLPEEIGALKAYS